MNFCNTFLTVFFLLTAFRCMAQDAGHDALWQRLNGAPIVFVADGIMYVTNGGHDGERRTVSASQYMPEADSTGRIQFSQHVLSDTLCIPSLVDFDGNTYVVSTISAHGFEGCGYIRHLVVSDGISRIDRMAFARCPALESVSLPATISRLDRNPFVGCMSLRNITIDPENKIYGAGVGGQNIIIDKGTHCVVAGSSDFVFPQDVLTIGSEAFSGYVLNSELQLPAGVETIAECAFAGCLGLDRLVLPPSLQKIGNNAFLDTDIKSMHIPASVSSIGSGIFSGCNNLRSISVDPANAVYDSRQACNSIIETATSRLLSACASSSIPEGVLDVSDFAFDRLAGLSRIVLPATLVHVSPLAFAGCHNLSCIEVDENNASLDSRNGCNAVVETSTGTLLVGCAASTIPTGIRRIGKQAFAMSRMPSTLVLPDGITDIGDFAFEMAQGITHVVLPSTLSTLGQGAFAGCRDLQSVVIRPYTIRVVERWVFMDCINLEQVHIPAGCEVVDDTAFAGCRKLRMLTFASPETQMPDGIDTNRSVIY